MKDNKLYSYIFEKLSFYININLNFIIIPRKMIKYLLILLFPLFASGQVQVEEIKALEGLGNIYVQQNKWEEAGLIFEQLLEIDSKNANYHYKYGEALGRNALNNNKIVALFMMNAIKEEFLIAAKLDTTHIDSRWALVVFYTELPGIIGGSIKKALTYTEQLQILSPVDGYLSKGYVYEYDNEIELAEKNYKKAIEVGGSITCYNKMISFYKKNNNPKKAIFIIEEANKKLDINILNYRLGEVSAMFNLELDKGKKGLIKYIENFSSKDEVSLEWAYLRLAQIYKHEANKVNAIKWINNTLELQPEFKLALKEKKLILNM